LKDPGSDSECETKQSTIVTINISIATAIVSVREHRFRFRFGSHWIASTNNEQRKLSRHWWSSLDIIRIMSAQAFWDVAAPLIAVTEKHPFLVAMVDGSLDMDSFQYYVVQDALYLHDFAYALRRLGDNDGISRQDSERLHAFAKGAEEAELSLHNSFFKEWNISDDGVEQMPHSLLYTSYMKQVVATRPHAEGLAVLLPCFWVYMHVGQCMLKLRQELGDRYVIGVVLTTSTSKLCRIWFCLTASNHSLTFPFSRRIASKDLRNSMPGSTCTVGRILNTR
jgi:thiaminase